MARNTLLIVTLCSVLLINIIAIVLLNNRLADQETAPQLQVTSTTPTPSAAPALPIPLQEPVKPLPVPAKPAVRTLKLLAPDCADCYDVQQYVSRLDGTINLSVETVPQDKTFLFHSDKLPALAFNASLVTYFNAKDDWSLVGYNISIPTGAYAGLWYVLPSQPPYYSPTDTRVHGLVHVTYLTMAACQECYDVTSKKVSLDRYEMRITDRTMIDAGSAEGKALVAKYNITAVPTMLLNAEAAEYPVFVDAFKVVGTTERDGTMVLRDLQSLQVNYYDLSKQKLMKP